jgi:hypothetical protein
MIQRFGGSLNPNPHGHVVAPDGVFVRDHDTLIFVELPPPSDHDIAALARAVARRIDRWLAQQQVDDDHGAYDDDWLQPLLAETQPARRPAWLVAQPIPAPSPRCAEHHGYTVHAQTAVAAHDRPGLEQLLRYGLRGPLAAERLSVVDQGRSVRYRFARPWRNGRTHIDLDPLAFMRRLALLIPPPRQRLLRCQGLFAPRATHRNLLAPLLPQPAQPADGTEPISAPNAASTGDPSAGPSAQDAGITDPAPQPPPRLPPRTRHAWADLLRRVFAIDVLTCALCGGRMRLIALLSDPNVLAKICTHLGWPISPPPLEPARIPRQLAFDDADADVHTPTRAPLPAARAPPLD